MFPTEADLRYPSRIPVRATKSQKNEIALHSRIPVSMYGPPPRLVKLLRPQKHPRMAPAQSPSLVLSTPRTITYNLSSTTNNSMPLTVEHSSPIVNDIHSAADTALIPPFNLEPVCHVHIRQPVASPTSRMTSPVSHPRSRRVQHSRSARPRSFFFGCFR